MEKNNGGPAFPCSKRNSYGELEYNRGLSIRDYFAAKAMNGMLNGFYTRKNFDNKNREEFDLILDMVNNAFVVADAMIAEREK